MIRNTILTLIIITATVFTARWLLNSPDGEIGVTMTEGHADDDHRGPNNGRLLEDGLFALEITIFESGVDPEFHVYPYYQGQAVPPGAVDLEIELARTGNIIDRFDFVPQGDYLRGNGVVAEPHSFDVTIMANYQGGNYRWTYENYEGRTRISTDLAEEAGIRTEVAGPAIISEILSLTGRVEIDPNRLSQIRPRFPGVVQSVLAELGDIVRKGDHMLTVQSNESLQSYTVSAPINGLVINRNVQVGEATSGESLFTIVDLSHVWVELDVFAKDVGEVKQGQTVSIETLDGYITQGVIDWLAPLSSHTSQSIRARVPMDNRDGNLRPGQFVRAELAIADHEVPLAVKQSAVQQFRDFRVVFAKFGETYEVRMLEPGIGNNEWLEVTGGLEPGTEYVTENSYLVKADIEKSGASHDH